MEAAAGDCEEEISRGKEERKREGYVDGKRQDGFAKGERVVVGKLKGASPGRLRLRCRRDEHRLLHLLKLWLLLLLWRERLELRFDHRGRHGLLLHHHHGLWLRLEEAGRLRPLLLLHELRLVVRMLPAGSPSDAVVALSRRLAGRRRVCAVGIDEHALLIGLLLLRALALLLVHLLL